MMTEQGDTIKRRSRQGKASLQMRMFKTKMCKWLEQGKCSRGEACLFAHSEEELRDCPDLRMTRMCARLETTGFCPAGHKCRFAHSRSELRDLAVDDSTAHVCAPVTLNINNNNNIPLSDKAGEKAIARQDCRVKEGEDMSPRSVITCSTAEEEAAEATAVLPAEIQSLLKSLVDALTDDAAMQLLSSLGTPGGDFMPITGKAEEA